MDDEVKNKLDAFEKLIADNKSYVDNMSRLLTWYGGGLTIIFAAAAVIFNWNFNSDRTSFNDQINRALNTLTTFETQITKTVSDQLGKSEDAVLELYAHEGKLLSGQSVEAEIFPIPFSSSYGNYNNIMSFNYVVKNLNNVVSGPLYFKVYLTQPLDTGYKSADEPGYEFESNFPPASLNNTMLPGNISVAWNLTVFLRAKNIKEQKYQGLIKVYYGKGKVRAAPVTFVIKKDTASASSSSPSSPPPSSPPSRLQSVP